MILAILILTIFNLVILILTILGFSGQLDQIEEKQEGFEGKIIDGLDARHNARKRELSLLKGKIYQSDVKLDKLIAEINAVGELVANSGAVSMDNMRRYDAKIEQLKEGLNDYGETAQGIVEGVNRVIEALNKYGRIADTNNQNTRRVTRLLGQFLLGEGEFTYMKKGEPDKSEKDE